MNDDVKLICFSVDSTPLLMKHCRWAKLLSESSDLSKEAEINLLKKIKIAGRICCVGTVFVCHLPVLNESVQFMRFSDILVSSGRILFIMEHMETCYLCVDRFAYVVIPQKTFMVIGIKDFVFNAPIHSFLYKNTLYVIPNYYHFL